MSGGIAYIYHPNNTFKNMLNPIMIDLDPMDNEAQIELKGFIANHAKYTNSNVAKRILDNWQEELKYFIKVMPKDFKRVLAENSKK
jgi:glutamate synthase (NADPH/NADH) large chain